MKAATKALGHPVRPSEANNSLAGQQSTCLYVPEGSEPGTFGVDLSWNPKSVANFTNLHHGHPQFVSGTFPGSETETIPAPNFTRVSVGGIPAYWLPSQPAPMGNGRTAHLDQLFAMKSGYVIDLTSMSLSESQDQRTLAAILSRL